MAGPRTVEARHLPIPEVGDGDGLLRVEACVLCGFATPPGLGGRYASYHHPEPDNMQPIRRSYLTERVGELGPDRTEICRALRALADC